MHDTGLALFFWMAVGFTAMYTIVSTFLFNAHAQPVIVRIDDDLERRRSRHTALDCSYDARTFELNASKSQGSSLPVTDRSLLRRRNE